MLSAAVPARAIIAFVTQTVAARGVDSIQQISFSRARAWAVQSLLFTGTMSNHYKLMEAKCSPGLLRLVRRRGEKKRDVTSTLWRPCLKAVFDMTICPKGESIGATVDEEDDNRRGVLAVLLPTCHGVISCGGVEEYMSPSSSNFQWDKFPARWRDTDPFVTSHLGLRRTLLSWKPLSCCFFIVARRWAVTTGPLTVCLCSDFSHTCPHCHILVDPVVNA